MSFIPKSWKCFFGFHSYWLMEVKAFKLKNGAEQRLPRIYLRCCHRCGKSTWGFIGGDMV